MTEDRIGPLLARADLHLVVDDVEARIVGDGSRLTMSTSDAPALLARAVGATPSGGLGSLRRAADLAGSMLNDAGLSLEVVGPGGTLVQFGAGCGSRMAQLLLGTAHAELGAFRSVAGVAAGYVRHSSAVRARAYQTAAGIALAGVLVAGARRRIRP